MARVAWFEANRAARNNFGRQVAIDPKRTAQIEREALFADVAGFCLLLESQTGGIDTGDHHFCPFFLPHCGSSIS